MAVKRDIDVRAQKKLSFAKCFQLVRSGVIHRLLRSTLTMAVILLAVAFFMSMLTENAFTRATAKGVINEVNAHRLSTRTLGFMFNAPSANILSENLAAISEDENMLRQYASVSGMKLENIRRLGQTAAWEKTYLDFFKNIGIGKRLILVRKNKNREIFAFLSEEENWQQFVDRMEPMKSLKLPGDFPRFKAFIKNFEEYEKTVSELEQTWRAAVNSFISQTDIITKGEKIEDWLCNAKPERIKLWQQLAMRRGFELTDGMIAKMQEQLRDIRIREEITATLNSPEKKAQWQKLFFDRPSLQEKMDRLVNKKVAALLDDKYSLKTLKQVSKTAKYERKLSELERDLASRTEAKSGGILSGRQLFLLLISFMVCMVGIANAMLMAITERFREIATMKCLGATDGFILTQFMMEAGLQGLAGGIFGMLIGFVLAFLKSLIIFGGTMLKYFPIGDVLICGCISIAVGIVLACIASLYPSWAASRMAPMEAMRIE